MAEQSLAEKIRAHLYAVKLEQPADIETFSLTSIEAFHQLVDRYVNHVRALPRSAQDICACLFCDAVRKVAKALGVSVDG